MLEESWNLWNLDDVVTWICSLEPSGKFHKYKDNLRKLKYLEEPAHGKKRSKKDLQFGHRLRKFKGKSASPITEQVLMNRLNDRESDEYDRDSARSDDEDHGHHSLDDSKSPDMITHHGSADPPDTTTTDVNEGGGNGGAMESDMEGKHDAASGLSADSADDHHYGADHGMVAIADPQQTPRTQQHAVNGNGIAVHVGISSIKAMKSNEGQYHVHYSDSEQSNNDKHGANEVVFQALMPHKSSDEEDDPVLKSIDVEKLLDTMDNEILSNMLDDVNRREKKSKNKSDDLGNLQKSHPDKHGGHRRVKSTTLRQDFDGNGFGDNGSTTSSSPALSDASYSAPDEPILDSINSTVLKMCGIRNVKDRKVMMYHIESLRNGLFSSYNVSSAEEEEVESERIVVKVETSGGDKEYGKGKGQGHALEQRHGDDESDSDNGNTEISIIRDHSEDEVDDDDPTEYLCPITKQLMNDPVICSDGHSYERKAIEDWLSSHDKSPMTNHKLVTKQLFPNHSLRSMINEYRAKHDVK